MLNSKIPCRIITIAIKLKNTLIKFQKKKEIKCPNYFQIKLFVSLILLIITFIIGIVAGVIALSAKEVEPITGNVNTVGDMAASKFSDEATDVVKELHLIAIFGYFGGMAVLVITFIGAIFFSLLIVLVYKGKGRNALAIGT